MPRAVRRGGVAETVKEKARKRGASGQQSAFKHIHRQATGLLALYRWSHKHDRPDAEASGRSFCRMRPIGPPDRGRAVQRALRMMSAITPVATAARM